ncbi:hypothetical protein BHM03_00053714, partial [Ensete ventricosum]
PSFTLTALPPSLPFAASAASLAGGRPYGLVAADRARGWPPLAGCCPYGRPPLAGGLAAAGRPFARGALVAASRPLQVARPLPEIVIRMEKMKEVKRPPL